MLAAARRLVAGPLGRHILNVAVSVALAYGLQVGLVSAACRADVLAVLGLSGL